MPRLASASPRTRTPLLRTNTGREARGCQRYRKDLRASASFACRAASDDFGGTSFGTSSCPAEAPWSGLRRAFEQLVRRLCSRRFCRGLRPRSRAGDRGVEPRVAVLETAVWSIEPITCGSEVHSRRPTCGPTLDVRTRATPSESVWNRS
jgi:hypothetical protein